MANRVRGTLLFTADNGTTIRLPAGEIPCPCCGDPVDAHCVRVSEGVSVICNQGHELLSIEGGDR